MAKPKKTSSKAKPSVKIPDLKPEHNPKGGAEPVGAGKRPPKPVEPING